MHVRTYIANLCLKHLSKWYANNLHCDLSTYVYIDTYEDKYIELLKILFTNVHACIILGIHKYIIIKSNNTSRKYKENNLKYICSL